MTTISFKTRGWCALCVADSLPPPPLTSLCFCCSSHQRPTGEANGHNLASITLRRVRVLSALLCVGAPSLSLWDAWSCDSVCRDRLHTKRRHVPSCLAVSFEHWAFYRCVPVATRCNVASISLLSLLAGFLFLHPCCACGCSQYYNDLWKICVNDASPASAVWQNIVVPGTQPPKRSEHVALTLGESMFVYGGDTDGGGSPLRVFGDLWQYRIDLNEWREVIPSGSTTPSPRFSHAAALIYSPVSLNAASPSRRLHTANAISAGPTVVATPLSQQRRQTQHLQQQRGGGIQDVPASEDASLSLDGRLSLLRGGVQPAPLASRLASSLQLSVHHLLHTQAATGAGTGTGGHGHRSFHATGQRPHTRTRSKARSRRGCGARGLRNTRPHLVRQLGSAPSSGGGIPMIAVVAGRTVIVSGLGQRSTEQLSDTWLFEMDGVANASSRVDWWVTGQWHFQHIPVSTTFERLYHSAVGVGNQLFVFGGFARVYVGPAFFTGLVYSDLLRVELPTSQQAYGGWQIASGKVDDTAPSARYDHRSVMVGHNMFLYGGKFQFLQTGLFRLNATAVSREDVWDWVRCASFLGCFGPGITPTCVSTCLTHVCQAEASDFTVSNDFVLMNTHFVFAVAAFAVLCCCAGFGASFKRSSRRRRFRVSAQVQAAVRSRALWWTPCFLCAT